MNGGRGALGGRNGIRYQQKKSNCQDWLNTAHDFIRLNGSVVKTVWPLRALPVLEWPFLSGPESHFNGTLLSALFFYEIDFPLLLVCMIISIDFSTPPPEH